MLTIKRVYEQKAAGDGFRILVDRLWPRGVSKEKAGVDVWLKDIAPSDTLRKWFGHDPKKWSEFAKKYKAEIAKNTESLATLTQLLKAHKTVTLVYGAKDTEHNQAVVLQHVLK